MRECSTQLDHDPGAAVPPRPNNIDRNYGNDTTRWIQAGLIESPAELTKMFECIDDVLTIAEAFDGSMEEAYKMHGHLLLFLQDLEGARSTTDLPDIPAPATFDTMHAIFSPGGASE
jgi:hypothetical protein